MGKEDVDWIEFCGLTCSGGSENRLCPCKGGYECPMTKRKDFEQERLKAQKRMLTQLRRGIEEDKKEKPN